MSYDSKRKSEYDDEDRKSKRHKREEKKDGKFTWSLRREKLKAEGKDPDANAKMREEERKQEIELQIERMTEMQKQRDQRRQDREVPSDFNQEEYDEEMRREEMFQFNQSKARAQIRVQGNRAHAIDQLYANVALPEFHAVVPEIVLQHLNLPQLKDTENDRMIYSARDEDNTVYWDSVGELLNYAIKKKEKEAERTSSRWSESNAVHKGVSADVEKIFVGKTIDELNKLEKQISSKIDSGQALDEEYWESMLETLKIFRARCICKQEIDRVNPTAKFAKAWRGGKAIIQRVVPKPKPQVESLAKAKLRRIQAARMSGRRVLNDRAAYKVERQKGLTEKEEEFNVAFPIEREYKWTERMPDVQPRMPLFYNRVIEEIEWNKYNITHYDDDNPPPKTPQGYKFTLFYGEMIPLPGETGTHTPKWRKHRIDDDPNHILIEFVAGPPYKNIAFKIENKPWEMVGRNRNNFKNCFQNGVLSLWFEFKRFKYRR